jgi:hypothetical protein
VRYELWNINCKPERGLKFIFHNSYITLRLTVYISQFKHYAQTYSLYFTTHTPRSGLQCKPERDVWVVKYKLQAWAWCMSCEIQTIRRSVMHELWNINCMPERDVWVVKCLYFTTHTLHSGLHFIFHNSYITLRLAVYISQLIHHAQPCSLYFTTERKVWVVK